MALKGELREFTAEHVLRLLELSGQTGTLDVRGPAAKVSIEVTGGAVSNVRGTDDTETALGRALLLREGTFAFRPGPAAERVVDAPLDELIERARTKATEAIEVEAAIPDESVRFRLSERATSGSAFTVGADELKVLMQVGGGRSVREIRQRSRMPRSRSVALLYGLLQKGLIDRAEAEAAMAVEVTGPASRRSWRRRAPAVETPAAEPAIEVAPAAAAAGAAAADLDAGDLTDELDARLAALAGTVPPVDLTAGAEAAGEQIVVTPSLASAATPPGGTDAPPQATVVFALHYMPATAQPAETPAPVATPKRRGLFDFVLRRPSAPGTAAQPEIDIPSPAELATLANAVHTEYKRQAEAMAHLGSHADRSARAFEATLSARLARVYELRAVGSRIPLRGDEIDVEAIERGDVAPARVLPYLALLVRDLREEAILIFGADDARATYAAVVERTFGRQVASPTMILRHADLPPRGRLRRKDGTGTPFELRDRTYVIGRAASSDLAVADEKVSSRHAQLVPDVLGFRLRDLGSTNGTYVNGERLSADRLLSGGETIRVGDTSFGYERAATGS